jgi:hypothetical protein
MKILRQLARCSALILGVWLVSGSMHTPNSSHAIARLVVGAALLSVFAVMRKFRRRIGLRTRRARLARVDESAEVGPKK